MLIGQAGLHRAIIAEKCLLDGPREWSALMRKSHFSRRKSAQFRHYGSSRVQL
jgi:hypothetical protein